MADEPHFLRSGEEAALGLLDDEDGLAVCTDAVRDAQLAGLLLATVRGVAGPSRAGGGPARRRRRHGARLRRPGRPPGVPVAARRRRGPMSTSWWRWSESGFNHVAAPLVRWAWEGCDLGVVQEPLADRSAGWALGPDLAARLLRVRRLARGRRRRLRRRGQGARHHDGAHAPGPRPGLPARARARRRLGRRGAKRRSPRPMRRCWRRRASPSWSSGCASPRRASRSSAPTATSIWAARRGRTRGGWSATVPPAASWRRSPSVRLAHPAGRRGRPAVVDAPGQCGGGGRA